MTDAGPKKVPGDAVHFRCRFCELDQRVWQGLTVYSANDKLEIDCRACGRGIAELPFTEAKGLHADSPEFAAELRFGLVLRKLPV